MEKGAADMEESEKTALLVGEENSVELSERPEPGGAPDPPPSPPPPPPQTPLSKMDKWRNIVGFWILGLANNYPYVVMLSAAFDIVSSLEGGTGHTSCNNATTGENASSPCTPVFNETTNSTRFPGREQCNKLGTSIILLADVLPTFFIKLLTPYFMNFIPYWIRVLSVVLFSILSFVLVGVGTSVGLILFGVVCASISSGFGEITFLSFTARYDKSSVSGWSSGTGAAGVFGSLIYVAMRQFLSIKATLLIQIFMPLLMLLTFIFVLGKPGKIHPPSHKTVQDNASQSSNSSESDNQPLLAREKKKLLNFKFIDKEDVEYWVSHVKYIPRLFKYMLPLFFVYWAEYMINQGFFELLYGRNTHLGSFCLTQKFQYRVLQVVYQVGVFISRSSVSLFHFKYFWILSVLQVFNFVFFFSESVYLFLPSFWLTFLLVLYEGLLGGAVYVNAFYAISKQVPKIHREFSMGVASVADSSGIVLAGVTATFVHRYICREFIGFCDT